MLLTLEITQAKFTDEKLVSLTLTVRVAPDETARGSIAAPVPVPKAGIPSDCKLLQHFVDFSTPPKK